MTRTRLLFAFAALAALAAWGVERLVVTDREAIEALVQTARDAVVRDDWEGFASVLAEDYEERGLDRAGAVAWIRDLWRRSEMRSVAVDVEEVRVEGDRAGARVTVRPGLALGGMRFAGRIDLERRPEGWRITGMAPDDAGFLPRSGG